MRNVPPPPQLNKLATWLVALSCLAAVAAVPRFGMAVLSGQTTEEVDIASYSAEVMQAAKEDDTPGPLAAGLGRTLSRRGTFKSSEVVTRPSDDHDFGEDCIRCRTEMTAGYVYWHRTEGVAPPRTGHHVGHGEHEWWENGPCFMIHLYCVFPIGAQELVREISDAVAAQNVAVLADYTKMPLVDLFAERSAIQVRGCDGDTIAGHIPLNHELLAAIEAIIEAAAAQLVSGG